MKKNKNEIDNLNSDLNKTNIYLENKFKKLKEDNENDIILINDIKGKIYNMENLNNKMNEELNYLNKIHSWRK